MCKVLGRRFVFQHTFLASEVRAECCPSRRWQSLWAGLQTCIMWSLCSICSTWWRRGNEWNLTASSGCSQKQSPGTGTALHCSKPCLSNIKRSPRRRKENWWSLPEDSGVPVTLGQFSLDKQMTLYYLWIETTLNSHILPAAELPGFLGVGDREHLLSSGTSSVKNREKLCNFYCSFFFSQVRILKVFHSFLLSLETKLRNEIAANPKSMKNRNSIVPERFKRGWTQSFGALRRKFSQ